MCGRITKLAWMLKKQVSFVQIIQAAFEKITPKLV